MHRPIKVVYVLGGLPFGGVEVWLLDLVVKLRSGRDIEPYVINLSGTGDLIPRYFQKGINVVSIGNNKKCLNTHRLDTVFALRSQLKKIAPDIIHTFHFSGDYFGRLASIGMRKTIFTHLRNVKSERKVVRRLANKILSYTTTCYLSVSKQVARTIELDHNIAGRPSRVLYNAVSPERLKIDSFDLKELHGISGKTILGIGRFVKQKNFDKLIKAFALVCEEHTDTSLLLLGNGGMMEELQKLVKDLGLEQKVCLPGFVKNEDIPGYLKAAYVLAMPSDYEGLPITHVEGLFCGLPAVISEYVPSIEIAADSSLVCATEVEDIAAKISLLLNDSDLYQQLSNAALSVATEHTIDQYIEELTTLYKEFL